MGTPAQVEVALCPRGITMAAWRTAQPALGRPRWIVCAPRERMRLH